jgi:hypothetical protein
MTTNASAPVNLLNAKTKLPANVWADHSLALLRLDRWLWTAQDVINKYYANGFDMLTASQLEMSDGRRYIRIDCISDGGRGQRSVHAFIDKKTGDVLRAAGYKGPAKHSRGNLFDSLGGTEMLTPHGIGYLG